MKVLFVSSGNSHQKDGIVTFIKSQGLSLRKEGVDLDFYPVKGHGFKGYFKHIKSLRKHVKEHKYDIIHAHYGLIGFLCILSFLRTPMVLSVMGDDAYGDFNSKGKRVWSSYFGMFLTQIALLFSKQIIVKSKNILNVIPYKKKAHIIPNGVDFEQFKPFNNELAKNKLLYLADITNPRKNYQLLESALAILNDKELTLVNPFPISHDEFPQYLNDSSVFILTSYNEGSPNVIKEAMACNIPIVSTDVGDVKEVIGNTEGCYLCSFDAQDLAEKIRLALAFGKRTNGRVDISHLEAGVVAKKIKKIYQSILEN
ncbi:glycosyltransferase family 4 protein [Flavobacteriaceae bacterium F08102]|nr:glycosyltransferase family 4 protein [Flavobacteriaceae bacterium F08102]